MMQGNWIVELAGSWPG